MKILQSLSYLLILAGSVGMMQFVQKFPFSPAMSDAEFISVRWLGMNGKQVWRRSWGAILCGTGMQLILLWGA